MRARGRRGCICAIVLLLAAGSARAEKPLATIEVTGERITPAEQSAPSSFVTVIVPPARSEPVDTVSEALAEAVGVQVRRFGGLGAFSTLSIRGSAANQVQVYLDGIPLSRARNETVNIADLPIDSLERIDVYRGSAPARFSVAGIGGVVNLVTTAPSATPRTTLSAAYGSFDTRKLTVTHTRRAAAVDVLGHVTYLGSTGNFSYLDDNGTPHDRSDDGRVTRRNNSFNSVNALLRASYAAGDAAHLDFTSETFFKDQGVPGPGNRNAVARHTSFEELRALHYLRFTRAGVLDPDLELRATAFTIYQRDRFRDPRGELGLRQERDDGTFVYGADTGATYAATGGHLIEALAELFHERFAPGFEDVDHLPRQDRFRASLVLQDQASFFEERVLLVPTLRYEYLRDRFNAGFDNFSRPREEQRVGEQHLFSPSLGVLVRALEWLSVKGNVGRFERAPNFGELFGTTGSVSGRPDLAPERGINGDVGFTAARSFERWRGELRLEYAFFFNRVDDLIILVEHAQGQFAAENVGAAEIAGHEITLGSSWLGHASLDVNYTHQDTEDRGGERVYRGLDLPLRPADELYTRLTLFADPGKVYYELNFVAGNFLDRVNFKSVPDRDIHTLGIEWRAYGPLSARFEAQNLTGNQIADVGGFPLPGRAFFAGVSASF